MTRSWWVWVAGALLLLLLGGPVLGVIFGILGLLLGGVLAVAKVVFNLVLSLVGLVLGSAVLGVLVLGGVGYLGYRRWKRGAGNGAPLGGTYE